MVETAKLKFKDVDALYKAHHQTTLPLLLLKLEVEMHMKRLMPKCRMEDLGGNAYAELTFTLSSLASY